jgi:hypothetical protein
MMHAFDDGCLVLLKFRLQEPIGEHSIDPESAPNRNRCNETYEWSRDLRLTLVGDILSCLAVAGLHLERVGIVPYGDPEELFPVFKPDLMRGSTAPQEAKRA